MNIPMNIPLRRFESRSPLGSVVLGRDGETDPTAYLARATRLQPSRCNPFAIRRVQSHMGAARACDTVTRGENMKYLVGVLAAVLTIILATVVHADNDVSKVNGSVRVEAGRTVGEVSSVNGSVRIEENVTAEDIDTVNGSITIGARSKVASIDTVNGSVTLDDGVTADAIESVNGRMNLGADVRVDGDVTAVNGSMTLGRGAHVGGNLENVNGSMELNAARVDGRLKTKNGDITVGSNSRVGGGMLVEKPNMGWFNRKSRNPKIVIGPNAIVEGTLTFEREVDLYVSETAQVGRIEGASAVRFSGERP
jgi:hypothetical protein